MTERKGLCEACARVETTKAIECREREKAAKARGKAYTCTCEPTVCTHASANEGTSDG